MPRLALQSNPPRQALSGLQRGLHAWLAAGLAAMLLLPISAWQNLYFGWLPYWLLIAPSLSLSLLHRQRIAAALSAFLVRGRRRRKPSSRRQARRSTNLTRRGRRAPMPLGALIEG